MTSPDPVAQTAGLGFEPTFSAKEAAVLLGRSFSWLDRHVRDRDFVRPDGTQVQPLRSPGRYRFFTVAMVRDIATCCYRRRWFSFREVKSTFNELAVAAHQATGEY